MIQLILIFSIGLILIIGSSLLFYKMGWRSILTLLFPILLLFTISQENSSEFFPIIFAPLIIGLTAGYSFKYKKTIQFFLLFSSLSLTVLFSGNYFYLKIEKNLDILIKSRESITDIVKSSNIPENERREFMERVDQSLDIVKDIVPFTYFLNSIIFSLISFFFIRLFMKKYIKNHGKGAHGIEFFKLNDYFIYTLIFGWLAVLLVDKSEYNILYISGLNIALIFSVLYLIQSIGIFKFFLIKKGLPQFIIPLLLFVILFLGFKVVLFVSIILISIGAIDFWADFRKLGDYNKKELQ